MSAPVSASAEILRTYRAPRAVMRRLIDALGRDERPEARLLVYLLAGCFIVFVGQVPGLAGQAPAPDGPPREALLGITFFAWLFVWPLFFYALAALAHLAARALGAGGSFLAARAALFWTLLAVSPLMLLRGVVQAFYGPGSALMVADGVVGLAFCCLWVISLREAGKSPAR